jgi:hypothetical protein
MRRVIAVWKVLDPVMPVEDLLGFRLGNVGEGAAGP